MNIDTHMRLPPDLYRALIRESKRLGMTQNQFVILVLSMGMKSLGWKT